MTTDFDVFGDASLFDEFDKERDQSGSFCFYEKDESGIEDRSKILFQVSDSSSSSSSENESDDEQRVNTNIASTPLRGGNAQQKKEENGMVISEESSEDEDETCNGIVSKERLQTSTMYKLNHERNKFRRYSKLIDSTRFIQDEESPAVMILFQNNKFSRRHKTQIEEFVKCLMEEEEKKPYESLPKLDLKATVPSCSDLNDSLPVNKRTDRMWQTHSIIGCSHYYTNFMIDTLGWPLVEYNPSLTDGWEIPTYEQVYTDIFPVDGTVIKKEKERPKPSCWNCGGDHMLTDCKEPRNQQKINESRQAMLANKSQQGSGPPKSGRYHKETQEDPKYGAFKPGTISSGLREALGLQDNQLPLYIYKMRALGYPPGWMEDAKSDPVLSMFDKDGNDGTDDSSTEGGQLDVTKIIEYPGFTVVNPPDIIDESGVYGMPPIQPHQLKATLMAHMDQKQQAQKRQQEEEEKQECKKMKLDTSDMDLDDQEESSSDMVAPPLPVDTPPSKPPVPEGTPPPTPPIPKRPSFVKGRSNSPSLEELEAQYQLLQKSLDNEEEEDGELIVLDSCEDDTQSSMTSAIEIEDSQDDEPVGTGDTSKNPINLDDTREEKVADVDDDRNNRESSEESKFVVPKIVRTGSTSSIQTFGELGTGSPGPSQPGTPQPSSHGELRPPVQSSMSISKDYGTPIMKRAGSVEVLPSNRNFAEGIEDHIPFENLPDSTGTFEKMRSLIHRIRHKVKRKK